MSKIDDVRNYTYRQIQFLIRQKETSVGKAMLANLRRGIGKTPGELPELWGAFLNEGSLRNVGVVKSICKQKQTAAYQSSNHGISATGGFTSHGYSCRNRVSFVN